MQKLCTFAGCRVVVKHDGSNTSPRCAKHKNKQVNRAKYLHHTNERGQNLYHTKQWRKIRKAHLLLHPYCVTCQQFHIATIANTVDHIKEINDGGGFFDRNNLQSLCPRHHNVKTGIEKKKRNGKQKPLSLSDFKWPGLDPVGGFDKKYQKNCFSTMLITYIRCLVWPGLDPVGGFDSIQWGVSIKNTLIKSMT